MSQPMTFWGLWEVSAYAIVIVNIGSNLVLLVFLGRLFRVDLSIRRNENIARRHALAVVIFEFPFQGSNLRELDVVSA